VEGARRRSGRRQPRGCGYGLRGPGGSRAAFLLNPPPVSGDPFAQAAATGAAFAEAVRRASLPRLSSCRRSASIGYLSRRARSRRSVDPDKILTRQWPTGKLRKLAADLKRPKVDTGKTYPFDQSRYLSFGCCVIAGTAPADRRASLDQRPGGPCPCRDTYVERRVRLGSSVLSHSAGHALGATCQELPVPAFGRPPTHHPGDLRSDGWRPGG
jgi:hypothetical protein